jgi:hypothetical protein
MDRSEADSNDGTVSWSVIEDPKFLNFIQVRLVYSNGES